MVWTATSAVVLIVALAVLVRALEPSFAFFPLAGETVTPADLGVRYEALTVPTRDGEQLRAWLLPADAPPAHVVYFHGNGGNLSVWAPILADIARRGYAVLAFDYRGYGRSTGRPTERGLYRDVDAILDVVSRGASHAPIVYWGRSLGTALAAYAASVRPPDGLILESGFPDARSLLRSSSPALAFLALFSTYRFPTSALLRRVRAPALVLHGDADQIVPFALGRALFDSLEGPKRFVTVRGGDHNDIAPADASTYWSAVDAFLSGLERAGSR